MRTLNIDIVKQDLAVLKAFIHSVLIPVSLTFATSNILYAFVYVLFTTFVYAVLQPQSESAEIVLFANKIFFVLFAVFATLVVIGSNLVA